MYSSIGQVSYSTHMAYLSDSEHHNGTEHAANGDARTKDTHLHQKEPEDLDLILFTLHPRFPYLRVFQTKQAKEGQTK